MYRILSSLLAIVILSIVSWQAFREGNYLGGALAAAGIIGLTGLIFYFINTTNRKLTYFFSALENDDYTIRFVENEGMQSERLLNHILNRIKSIIQNTRIEIQQKERYYELILNSISSGVIALDDNGFVLQLNRFALKLIDLEVFTMSASLEKFLLFWSKHLKKSVRVKTPESDLYQRTGKYPTADHCQWYHSQRKTYPAFSDQRYRK